MTPLALERREKFGVARVYDNSFAVIGRNLGLLIGLGALFSALPAFVLNLSNHMGTGSVNIAVAKRMVAASSLGNMFIYLMSFAFLLLYFVLALLFQSALVRATIEDLNGKSPTMGDCVHTALHSILPTVGIAVVVSFGLVLMAMLIAAMSKLVSIFSLLLLIPGIMLLLGVSVSVPVLIQERLGVFGSMSRSRDLTKGSRWSILGLFVVLFLVAIVLQLVFALLSLPATFVLGNLGMAGVFFGSIGGAVISTAVSTLISVAIAVSYVELRQIKEGIGIDELAEIFS